MRTAFVIFMAAALLGGCFYSEDALISRGQADFPLETGTYSHTPYLADGVTPFDRPAWTGQIDRSWGRYVSDDDSFVFVEKAVVSDDVLGTSTDIGDFVVDQDILAEFLSYRQEQSEAYSISKDGMIIDDDANFDVIDATDFYAFF